MENQNFSTPVSKEQFRSLRERMARESPRLYRNKVLSDPREPQRSQKVDSAQFLQQDMSTPGFVPSSSSSPPLRHRPEPVVENPPGETVALHDVKPLGSFESENFRKLSRLAVNKEWETRKIVANLIALAIWNLVTKFYLFFIRHTQLGKKLYEIVFGIVENSKLCININKVSPLVLRWLTWDVFHVAFHWLIIFNAVVSLIRLVKRTNIDSLNLNEKQKQLLGLDSNNFNNAKTKKPRLILANYDNSSTNNNSNSNTGKSEQSKRFASTAPSTPFMFKSLQTPLRSDSIKQTQSIDRRTTFSKTVANSILYKNNYRNGVKPTPTRSAPLPTPVGRTGYIPSSKYAYMKDSPSPRKRTG